METDPKFDVKIVMLEDHSIVLAKSTMDRVELKSSICSSCSGFTIKEKKYKLSFGESTNKKKDQCCVDVAIEQADENGVITIYAKMIE